MTPQTHTITRNVRGNLQQRQWISLQGIPLRAFEVVNRHGKILAIGALSTPDDDGFIVMHAKRYTRDRDLIAAITELTDIVPRQWPTRKVG